MKTKKPEIISMLRCSSGPPVETLDLWKRVELVLLLNEVEAGANIEVTSDFIIENAERFVAILGIKEKGRPNGAKDRKPRAKRTAEAAAAKAA